MASSAEIARLNAEYGESGLKIVVPTCGPETVWKLEKALTARLQAFRQSETLHALSHASYFLLGSAAGLFYGNSLNELVSDRIGDINAFYPDAKVREDALLEAIKQLPRKNQTAKKFLRSLKQKLQSYMERPVTKTRSQMLAIGQLEANSPQFPGVADKDGDAGVTGLAADEDLTENTEDEDDSISTSGIANLGLEEPDNTDPLSNSRGCVPSAVSTTVHAKAASAPVPPEGDSGLVGTSRPTGDAGSAGRRAKEKEDPPRQSDQFSPSAVFEGCSIPCSSESVVDEEPKTTVTTTMTGSSPSAEDGLPDKSAESSQGLSMLEQLRIISQTSQQDKEGTHKGAPPSTSGKQQAASNPRPAENGPSPRVASTQAHAPLRTPKSETGGRGGATRSAGAGTQRFFHQHPLLDDPFFGRSSLGGSMLNDPFFADFFGLRRSAPARAQPTPGQNSNLNVIGENGQKVQIPPCAICSKSITLEGGLTCMTCTQGKKIACADCIPKVRGCAQDKHQVLKVEFQR
ncbi:MAG: hypothetical protein Q9197_003291 [Variospora fuerteventurae]